MRVVGGLMGLREHNDSPRSGSWSPPVSGHRTLCRTLVVRDHQQPWVARGVGFNSPLHEPTGGEVLSYPGKERRVRVHVSLELLMLERNPVDRSRDLPGRVEQN